MPQWAPIIKALSLVVWLKPFNHRGMKYSEFTPIDLDRASTQQLALVTAAFSKKAPDMWRDIAELNFVALRFNAAFKALPDPLLAEASVGLVYQLASSFGGHNFYMPNGWASSRGEKYALIVKEYRGNNIRELAIKYRVSENRIRQIIQEEANRKKAEQQHGGK